MRDELWELADPLVGPQLFNEGKYNDAIRSTRDKAETELPVSVVDAYGRLISYHLL